MVAVAAEFRLSGNTNAVVTSINLATTGGLQPRGIAANPATNLIYVANGNTMLSITDGANSSASVLPHGVRAGQ